LKEFPKIIEFFFQGSETCTTAAVEKRFKAVQSYAEQNLQSIKKK
jgi:Mg2+/Co2+ transporter CorB